MMARGQLSHAENACRERLRHQPSHFDALHLLGVIALRTRRPDEAAELLQRAITLRPDHADSHFNRGNALRDLARPEDALASYNRAIAHRPDDAEAFHVRGDVLRVLGRIEDALASYAGAIQRDPDHAGAHNSHGTMLRILRRPEAAIADFDRAIALRPDFAGAHVNRGDALRELGRSEQALPDYDTALTLKPDHAEAFYGRGAVLWELARPEAALASYENAIALKPDFAEARFNKGVCQLAMGDYEHGWEGFEWRWRSAGMSRIRNFTTPPWRGDDPIAGKTILVVAEQGFGDSLQFCRYVPMLACQATVILDMPRPLARLFSRLNGVAGIVVSGEPLPAFDAWVPMMNLPLAFRTTVETIPAAVPYLFADAEQSAGWHRRLAALPGLKVGIVWAGAPRPDDPNALAIDRRRSIDPLQFAPLAAIPALSLISLQKGNVQAPAGLALHDWTDELHDFADTAALIDALDLVISVDTSVAHLAGALGKPVWVLNRYDQCWRWLRDRTDSPWYPTARLFRQPSAGDWASVIRDVADALRQAASST